MARKHMVVVGSGPAGIEAALEGADLGARTSLVVEEALGGNAVQHSLVPSKVMIAAASGRHQAAAIGAEVGPVDWGSLARRVVQEQELERDRAQLLLQERSVELIFGHANVSRRAQEFVVEVQPSGGGQPQLINCQAVVGATGSAAVLPDGLAPDGFRMLLPRHLPGETPPSSPVAVLGAGVAGVEFASALANLGVETILVAGGERILPSFSPSATAVVAAEFVARGGRLVENFRIEHVAASAGGVTVRSVDGRVLEVAAVLVNLGRRPVLGAFAGLGTCGPGPLNSGGGFSLAGDSAGLAPMTQGAARHSGRVAARAALGAPLGGWTPDAEPRIVFSLPPVAAVGPCAQDLKSAGTHFESHRVNFDQLLAGRLEGQGGGHATALVDQTGALLGLEAVGAGAATVVGFASLARQTGITLERLGELELPTPSLEEVFERLAEAHRGMTDPRQIDRLN